MPDIGILPELGKALGVTVDEILMGEQIEQEKRAETAVSDEDKKLFGNCVGASRKKGGNDSDHMERCFWLSANLVCGGVDHSADLDSDSGKRTWIDLYKECNSICDKRGGSFLFWAGGMCIEKLRPIWKKKYCYCSNGDFISCRNCGLSILFSKAEGNR